MLSYLSYNKLSYLHVKLKKIYADIRLIALRFFTSFCHTLGNHQILFEGILHNGAKITLLG